VSHKAQPSVIEVHFETPYAGQDIMTSAKSKAEYYKDAAQFLNASDRILDDSGGAGSLAFMTRGTSRCRAAQK
jgi:hypothetical protein